MASLQESKNRLSPGSYFSPITNLYWLPRGVDFDNFAQNYSYFDRTRYLDAQNWWAIRPDGSWADNETQNPYWILNKNPVLNKNKNLYGSAALSYSLNSWLTAKVRGNYSYFSSDTQRNVAAFSQRTVLGSDQSNGKIYKNVLEKTTTYGDVLLIGNPIINDNISLDFTVGASISDLKYNISNIENNQLFVANLFTLNNLNWGNNQGESSFGNGRSYVITNPARQDQSVFASANLGYKNKVYLGLTFRNDWISTLAGTGNNGIDYESVGLNGILTEIFTLPETINFWKVRALMPRSEMR